MQSNTNDPTELTEEHVDRYIYRHSMSKVTTNQQEEQPGWFGVGKWAYYMDKYKTGFLPKTTLKGKCRWIKVLHVK